MRLMMLSPMLYRDIGNSSYIAHHHTQTGGRFIAYFAVYRWYHIEYKQNKL